MNTNPWQDINLPYNPFEAKNEKQDAADRKKQEQAQEKADAESERDAYNKKFKPELTDPAWSHASESRAGESPDSALVGDTLLLSAKSKDIVAGATVRCFIRDFAASAPWLTERKLSARVGNDDSVQVEWVIDKNKDDTENPEFKFWFETRNADSTVEAGTAQTPITLGKAQSVEYAEIPDTLFNSGSALPLPGESWQLAGILATVAAHSKEIAGSSLLVCGHASDADKGICSTLEISKWRSVAIKSLLDNDEDAWLDVAHDFSCSKDIQQFLVAVSSLWGKDCHPGDVNGVIGPESKTAIRNYKKCFNSSLKGNLPDSDAIDDAFLRSMVALYREVILDQYKQATGETSLPGVTWAHGGTGIFACGTSFKPDADAASKNGGRVEIFFITDAAKAVITDPPDPKTAPSCKEISIYGTGFTRTLVAPVQGSLSKKMSVDFIEIADIHFNHNCALPCLDSKGKLIGLLAQAFEYAKKHPDRECIVEGHADTSGDPEYNLAISKRRGESIKALLTGDVSLWNGVVEANGSHHKIETEDYQATLKALAEKYSWPCDPGEVDNSDGPKTKEAVKGFQTEYKKRTGKDLKPDGAIGPKTWEAIGLTIRSLLEGHLKNSLKLDPVPKIVYGYPDGNGIYPCGESCPIENAGDKDYKSAENRRVELVFYSKGEPDPVVPPAAGREIGLEKDPVSEKEWGKNPVSVSLVTPVVDKIEITAVPTQFAPSAEKCTIKYKVDAPKLDPKDKGSIVIKDSDGTIIFKKEDLTLDASKESTYEWDGKTSSGTSVDISKAPVKIQLSVTGAPTVTSSVKDVKIDVHSIDFQIPSIDASNRVFMNNPIEKMDVTVVVKLKKSDGTAVVADIPLDVQFTFSDPGANNTAQASSYKYEATPKYLGKTGDANAVNWRAHPDCTASSNDSYKTSCTVKTITTSGSPKLGNAIISFLPTGVGGDDFKIKASVFSSGGTKVLLEKESTAFTVWREVNFSKIYEMQGTNHVSSNATTAIIAPYFSPANVKYVSGAVNALAATYSVNYIGLWKNAATPQASWATVKAKLPAETPAATEIAEANYAGADPALLAKCTTARNKIIAKAQAWVNRIDADRQTGMDTWQANAGIPNNSIVGIKKFHPKYSTTADTVTSEWNLYGAGTPAWLRVTAFSGNYTNVDPDQIWVNGGHWGGLSVGNGVFLVPDYVAGVIVKVVCHEAGHASKSFFKRDDFGPSLDHSASNAGIMYFDTSGGNNFTDREKKILQGVVP